MLYRHVNLAEESFDLLRSVRRIELLQRIGIKREKLNNHTRLMVQNLRESIKLWERRVSSLERPKPSRAKTRARVHTVLRQPIPIPPIYLRRVRMRR